VVAFGDHTLLPGISAFLPAFIRRQLMSNESAVVTLDMKITRPFWKYCAFCDERRDLEDKLTAFLVRKVEATIENAAD
jgi:hypothetical protein